MNLTLAEVQMKIVVLAPGCQGSDLDSVGYKCGSDLTMGREATDRFESSNGA